MSGYLNIAVVQPNIPHRLKWDDRYGREILKKTFSLNAAATQRPAQLVVWRETAIPYYINEWREFHLTDMGQLPRGREDYLVGLLDSSTSSDRSGFLDPVGRWEQKTALFTEAVVAESIPLTNRLTFYTRFGDLIVYISYGVLGLFLFMVLRKKYFGETCQAI